MIDAITTSSGRTFRPLAIETDDIEIEDIAAHLANLCRFNGATRHNGRPCYYSVAQHSVWVSLHVPPRYALQGLLHDAAEAYIGDHVRPLKQCLGYDCDDVSLSVSQLEDVILQAICERFGVAWPIHASVWEADDRMLATEWRDLMPGQHDFSALPEPYPSVITPIGPDAARRSFLSRFHALTRSGGGRPA